MTALAVLALAWLGGCLNLAFSSTMIQPDWALALLLGSLLAHRGNWIWVLPGVALHDLMLHWSPWVCLPLVAAIPPVLIYLDDRLGAGLPQRMVLLLMAIFVLAPWGWGFAELLLTATLSVSIWYFAAKQYVYAA